MVTNDWCINYRAHSVALTLNYVQGCGEAQTGDGKNSAG